MIAPVSASTTMQPAVRTAAGLGFSAREIQHLPQPEQVRAAAGQFEAILLRQFLQESVGKIMGGESGGTGSGVYGYMLTDVLANKLAAGGGLGLGPVIERQLAPRNAAAPAPADIPASQ